MSIPGNKLSSIPIVLPLLEPNDRPVTPLTDWCRGGVALSDPSQTLDYQNWSIALEGEDVVVIPETVGSPSVIFSRPGITELSLAFDNNMRPNISFVQNGDAIHYFFDPVPNDYTFLNLPAGAITPRCTIDDVRPTQVQTSSVILGYVIDGILYMRDQRDRFTIEYEMGEVERPLVKIGMGAQGNVRRLHFVIERAANPSPDMIFLIEADPVFAVESEVFVVEADDTFVVAAEDNEPCPR